MRIIHTADWHLGQMYNNIHSRKEDHEFFFEQLNEYVNEHCPDVIIVAGDVYDVSNPSIEAQTLFTNEILKLTQLSQGATIIVTGGNHDSRRSLAINKELWQLANVVIIGPLVHSVDGHIDASTHVVPVERNGKTIGAVLALPFFTPNDVSGAGSTPEDNLRDELSRLRQEALDSYGNNITVVGTAHISVGINHRADDKMYVGGEYDFGTSAIPDELDYMALGHIHDCSKHRDKKFRYSGTPFDMDFGENTYSHCVLMVDAEAGQSPVVTEISLDQNRPMMDLTSTPIDAAHAASLANTVDKDEPAFVRIKIKADGLDHSDISMQLNELFADTAVIFCGLHTVASDEVASVDTTIVESLGDFYELTPMKIADEFWQSKNNAPMPEDLRTLFQEVLDDLDKYNDDGKLLAD